MNQKYADLKELIIDTKGDILIDIYDKIEKINAVLETGDKEIEDEMCLGVLIRDYEHIDYVLTATKHELFIGEMCPSDYRIIESYIPFESINSRLYSADYIDLFHTYEELVKIENKII